MLDATTAAGSSSSLLSGIAVNGPTSRPIEALAPGVPVVPSVTGGDGVMTAADVDTGELKVNFDDPPVCPPADCIDPVMWHLAVFLFRQHDIGEIGGCARCGGGHPCRGRMLAGTGLRVAMGYHSEETPYWRGYARIHGSVS